MFELRIDLAWFTSGVIVNIITKSCSNPPTPTQTRWGIDLFRNKKNPDLETKRRAECDFFYFPVLHYVFFLLIAIEKLFWNLRGVRRSCCPPPVSAHAPTW